MYWEKLVLGPADHRQGPVYVRSRGWIQGYHFLNEQITAANF